jgi:hypothetical protein
MSDLKEAARQALEELKYMTLGTISGGNDSARKAIVALQQALEQPADEPVAWMYDWDAEGESVKDWLSKDYDEAHSPSMRCHNIRPLYTRPQPPRELLGLTESKIDDLLLEHGLLEHWPVEKQIHAFVKAIKQASKEKNHE